MVDAHGGEHGWVVVVQLMTQHVLSLDLDFCASLRSHITLLIYYQTLTLQTKQYYTFPLIKHYEQ